MEECEDKYKNKKSQQRKADGAPRRFQESINSSISAPCSVKDYSDNVDLALAKLGARSNNHMAKAKSDKSKAFPERSEQSFSTQSSIHNLSDDDRQLKRDKNLLNLGVITKEQFNRKWGGKD